MKKLDIKSLLIGLIVGSIGLTTVFAAGGIKSAIFTDSKVYIKDKSIALDNPLALIEKEGSSDVKAYAPVRELLEKMGYMVSWNENDSSIHLYPKPFTENTFGVEAYQNQPMLLFGASHEDDIYFYSLSPIGNGAVITYKNIAKYFDWSVISPRLIVPQMKVLVYDGDGLKEIGVSLSNGSGTGISIDELHVVKIIDLDLADYSQDPNIYQFNDLIDYKYDIQDCGDDLDSLIQYKLYNKDSKAYIHLQSSNDAVDIDLSSIDPEAKDAGDFKFYISQDNISFDLHEDGSIQANILLCVLIKDQLTPHPIAAAKADVLFSNGTFTLSNIKIEGENPDITIASDVIPDLLKSSGKAADDIRWRKYAPVEYKKVLIVEGASDKVNEINAKIGYFQMPIGEVLYDYDFQLQLLPAGDTKSYILSEDVKFYFSSAHDKTLIELKDISEFFGKVKDGYTAWEVQTDGGKIVSLTNIQWRQIMVYRIIDTKTENGKNYLTVVPVIRNEYPSLLNTYRFDEINTPPMTLQVASDARITINDYSAPNFKVQSAKFEELVKQLKNNRYCYLSIDGANIVEIEGIHIP